MFSHSVPDSPFRNRVRSAGGLCRIRAQSRESLRLGKSAHGNTLKTDAIAPSFYTRASVVRILDRAASQGLPSGCPMFRHLYCQARSLAQQFPSDESSLEAVASTKAVYP